MAVSKERKAELVKKFGKNEKDTGSVQVQVALLTEQINALTAHLKKNKKELEVAIALMKIMCCASLSVTDYSDERFKKQKYMGVSYSELIPELEKRLKQQSLECDNSKTVKSNINES